MKTRKMINRRAIKRDMINFRVYKYGPANWHDSCWCDLCNIIPATEMHEIYSRNRSEKDEELRELSMQEELCSMLCRTCHKNLAHTPKVRNMLIERNIETYGRQRIQEACKKDNRLNKFFDL